MNSHSSESLDPRLELGAYVVGPDTVRFHVWAPLVQKLEVVIVSDGERVVELTRQSSGHFLGLVDGIGPGTRYYYRLDGRRLRPDPLSHFQPEGTFGPSEVIDQNFTWTDQDWKGIPLRNHVFYELHPGTFSAEGTFAGILRHLDELKELGVTTLEIMPISQFSGARNWGYDGVLHYAVHNTYGRPEDFKRLIDTCHRKGLAVFLDVVYNHLGPEGNWMHEYGPYFTAHYKTPWGGALNYDDAHSDEVRRYFVENAVYWVRNFHLDGLRLDAVQAILDVSAKHFLQELAEAVKKESARSGREIHLVGECDLNNERFVMPVEQGGLGLDSQWDDDFHHALHALATGERGGYYSDYGRIDQLAKAYREGFIYTGDYSPHRKKKHGAPARRVGNETFVVFIQNHDQTGNRAFGERLSVIVSDEMNRVAAAAVILSPFLPLLFMGEEYGEKAPFYYFVDHRDPPLIEAVRKGRREEFKAFQWEGEIPAPDAERTFLDSKLDHSLKRKPEHRALWGHYRSLLQLRREIRERNLFERGKLEVRDSAERRLIELHYGDGTDRALVVLGFGEDAPEPSDASLHLRLRSSERGPRVLVYTSWEASRS